MPFVINRSPIGPRQQIEVFNYRRQLLNGDFTAVLAKCDSGQTTPFGTCAETVQQVDEGHFAIEANDGIEARYASENLPRFEAGVMATHREMRGHSRFTQSFDHLAEVRRHVLKDQRKPDDIGFFVTNALQDLLGVGTVSHDDRLMT